MALNEADDETVQAATWRLALDADARGERPLGVDGWLALTAWLEADEARTSLIDASKNHPVPSPQRRSRGLQRRMPARRVWATGGALAAASVALAVWLSLPRPATITMATTDTSKSVVLADGTRVVLNRGGRLDARLGPHARNLRLAPGGQAALDVAHDASRPFTVDIDGVSVRVLGTRFDIDDDAGHLTVAVARGLVSVSQKGRLITSLPAGHALAMTPTGAIIVTAVLPETVSSWTRGALVYNRAPLSRVAADLSRYLGTRVEVDGDAASLHFTGALAIDKGPAMLARLVTFMPIEAYRTPTGLRLRSSAPHR